MGHAVWARALLIPVVASSLSAQSGTVTGITGRWLIGSKAVTFGTSLQREEMLSCRPGSGIQVSFRTENPPYRLVATCDESGAAALKTAKKQAESGGFFQRLVAAVEQYTHHSPERLIVAVSRGFGRDLHEAVVPLRDGHIDVAPAFRDVPAGEFQIRLLPLTATPAEPVSPIFQRVNWKPGGSVPLPAAGLKPGLYRLALLTASGDADAEAWILAGSPASYAANAAEFQQAIETTSKWAEELDRTAVRPALRTFLLSLAPGGMHEPGTR